MRSSIVVLLVVAATRGGAQQLPARADSTPPAVARSVSHDSLAQPARRIRPTFGRNTAAMLAGALGTGLVVSLADARLSTGTSHWGERDDLQRTTAIGNFIGGPVPITLGAVLYATGRGTGNTSTANLGREVIRAVAVSDALTVVVKGAVGRSRPFASPGDADVFEPGRGFTNAALASFPSGHTSAAFATATVLARELNLAHPAGRWLIDPVLFGGATLVGLSRVYDHQHWPSDVVAGAALGAVTGYEVVAHAHGDRSPIRLGFLSHLSLAPSKRGVAVNWSAR